MSQFYLAAQPTIAGHVQGYATTVGATTADVITFPMSATPGTYVIDIDMPSFNASTPAGSGYRIRADIRTTGAAGVVINTLDFNENEDAALIAADWDIVLVGNTWILRVTGVAGLTINWAALATYILVN